MSIKNKLSNYPEAYARILLALPATGEALSFTLSSPDAAQAERQRFYNFIKFLRRNPDEAAHFAKREYRVQISRENNKLSFSLRVLGKTTSELDFAQPTNLEGALCGIELPADILAHEAQAPEVVEKRTEASFVNPLAILEEAVREQEKNPK